jgi:hypothetical protein
MSVNIPNHFVIQFSTNITMLLQYKGTKLRSHVTEGSYVGEQASPVDQVGQIEMQQVTGRFTPMPRVDADVDRRWVVPSDWDLPQLIDKFDKLRLLTEPESTYTQNAVIAAGRTLDRLILQATTGTAKTGKQGGTNTSFNSANEVGVNVGGTNSRLNVAKLLELKEKMRGNHVDFDTDEVYVIMTAKDEASLMTEMQIISSDFNGKDRPVLREGKISEFLQFLFVYCELAEETMAGTNKVTVPAWAKSGMHLGLWNDISTSITQRNDLRSEPWQSYVYMTAGATRLEENKVYSIVSYRA